MQEQLSLLGWSQAELARRLAVSETTVTKWSRRGAPKSVLGYLDAMVRMRRVSDDLRELTLPPRKRARGKSAQGGREEVWQPSAADGSQQAPDGDYRSKLDRWEAADMDQDSDEWGRG